MVAFVSTYDIAPGVKYSIHPHHRDQTPGKCKWSISESQERDVFTYAYNQTWLLQAIGWGLHIVDGRAKYLGRAQARPARFFIAKFIDGNQNQTWHGYPADHQRNPSDIPSNTILKKWMDGNLLRRAVVRKIIKGQPCSL